MPTEDQLSAVAERMTREEAAPRAGVTSASYGLPGAKTLTITKTDKSAEGAKPAHTEAAVVADDDDKPQLREPADPTEAKARAKGWVPKEDFESDPGNEGKPWRSAKEFVERGELFESISKTNKRAKDTEETLSAVLAQNKKLMERLRQREIADKQKERDLAIELADKDKVRALDKDIAGIEKDFEPEPAKANKPQVLPEVEAWGKANQWFFKDPLARDAAIKYGQQLELENPDDVASNLEKTTRYIKKRFPDLFEESQSEPSSRRSAVEQPGRTQAPKRGKSFADLPDEAKRIGRAFAAKGLMSRDEYAKDYFDNFGA